MVILLSAVITGIQVPPDQDPDRSAPTQIRLEAVQLPTPDRPTAILEVTLPAGSIGPLVHPPRTRGAREGWDLGLDLIVRYCRSDAEEVLSEATLLYRNGETLALRLTTEQAANRKRALVVVSGRKATVFLDDHWLTRVAVEYEVVALYHHLHEPLLAMRPQLFGGAEQRHTSSNSVRVEVAPK